MKKVITYGTFDLLHNGHLNILKRAKKLGDYLIVAVTAENYDMSRGKLNVRQSLAERIENVKNTNLADEIIIEEYEGQKVNDVQKYNVDTFVIGSDWLNKFDYLKEYCSVVYLERTKGISSTELRLGKNKIIKMGIIGYGRIASRFIPESKYVSGINIESVYGMNPHKLEEFSQKHELNSWHTNFDEFMETVDAVYVASPHLTHYEYVKKLLNNNKHVLCEKPIVLSKKEAEELFDLASKLNLILFEGIKTTYAPCFVQLIGLAKSGVIGNIKNVEGTFTKLVTDKSLREYNLQLGGGSITELASYPLSAIAKLLGNDYVNCNFTTYKDKETQVDLLTKINLIYPESMATAVVGIGCKQEGSLVVSGTKGYIYVPAPWWKTEYFEIRFEDPAKTRKVFTKFESDGLRYELSEFLISINNRHKSHKLTNKDSIFISEIIEKFRNNENTYTIRESNN